MNRFLLKENKTLKEKYYRARLENGFLITVIPKSLPTKCAFLCCDFGGADIEYEHNGEKHTFPAGTAHFLEHKMFENEDGSDAFLEFDTFGGNANAFTSYENTCYYFSCTDNFFQNLDVLLKAVSSAHFTDASVEKEKKIITQEITMYDDLPSSNVARNLCRALYRSHPTVNAISGTVESISTITKETLMTAYNRFYVPENMSLCICGDVDLDTVIKSAEKYFGTKVGFRPKTVFHKEKVTPAKSELISKEVVAADLYAIGIKCVPEEKNDIEACRKVTAMRLAISLTFGRASDFFCKNYEKGLINERFYAGFAQSRMASHIVISGSGNDPERIMKLAVSELEHRKTAFFTEEQFLREKKAAYAESLTLFDSCEDLTAAFASNSFLDYDEYDAIEVLRDVTLDEVKAALDSVDTSNIAISIATSI